MLETVSIDELQSVVRKRTMQRDNVTGSEQLLQAVQIPGSRWKRPPALILFPLQPPENIARHTNTSSPYCKEIRKVAVGR